MNKRNFFVWLYLSAMMVLLASTSASAQVTIGSANPPSDFSLLDLKENLDGTSSKALHLPRLDGADREKLVPSGTPNQLAEGLMIFNTTNNCLEFWSGTEWISLCTDILPDNTIMLVSSAEDQILCFGTAIEPIVYATTGAAGANFSGLPAGTTAYWENNEISINGTPTASGTYNYTVTLTGGSNTGTASGTIIVNTVPAQPSEISGSTADIVAGTALTYSVENAGGVIYIWSLPETWEITSGQDTNSITVIAGGVSGSVSVTPNNGCGNGMERTLDVGILGCPVRSTLTGAPHNGWVTFMCHNLGAAESVENMTPLQQANAPAAGNYGWLYQWGRHTDNHQLRNSLTFAGPLTNANLNATTGQPTGTSANRFITNPNEENVNWRPRADDLWTRNNNSNDPCPSGWRVPTQEIWGSIAPATNNTWDMVTGNNGTAGSLIRPIGSSVPTLFLPAAGFRTRANIFRSVGVYGYYWSRTILGDEAHYLFFDTSDGFVLPNADSGRAAGLSIRCVLE